MLILQVIYVDKLLEYDLKEKEMINKKKFFLILIHLLVTGPTARPFSVRFLRRLRSFNFATLIPLFCKA